MIHVIYPAGLTLSKKTIRAWQWHPEVGIVSRSLHTTPRLKRKLEQQVNPTQDLLINAGNLHTSSRYQAMLDTGAQIVNPSSVVRVLRSPALTMQTLESLTPRVQDICMSTSEDFDVWVKLPGRKGSGSTRMHITELPRNSEPSSAVQVHVSGTEYRINTVGRYIVQGHRKTPTENGFEWSWVGVKALPRPTREILREAIDKIKSKVYDKADRYTCIAWDVIMNASGTPYILEGNTAGGTNEHTVTRIVSKLQQLKEDE